MKDSYYGKYAVILEHWNLESKAIDLKFAQTFPARPIRRALFHYSIIIRSHNPSHKLLPESSSPIIRDRL